MTQCTYNDPEQRPTAVGGFSFVCLHATAWSSPETAPIARAYHCKSKQLRMHAELLLSPSMAAEVVKKLEAATDYVCVTFLQNCSKQQVGWWVGVCMQQVAVDSSARSLAVQGSMKSQVILQAIHQAGVAAI